MILLQPHDLLRALCWSFQRRPRILIELTPLFRVTYWLHFLKTLFLTLPKTPNYP